MCVCACDAHRSSLKGTNTLHRTDRWLKESPSLRTSVLPSFCAGTYQLYLSIKRRSQLPPLRPQDTVHRQPRLQVCPPDGRGGGRGGGHSPRSPPPGRLCGTRCRWQRRRSRALRPASSQGCPPLEGKAQLSAAAGRGGGNGGTGRGGGPGPRAQLARPRSPPSEGGSQSSQPRGRQPVSSTNTSDAPSHPSAPHTPREGERDRGAARLQSWRDRQTQLFRQRL